MDGQSIIYMLADEFVQIHGWPDLSMGWRYQIPLLVDMGFRVLAPDMMGYGGTVSRPSPRIYCFW